MPWKCQTCNANVLDSSPECPECSGAKSSWTLQPNKTRDFVVSRAKFKLLRGEVTEATPLGQPLYDPYALVEPEVARVVSKADALALFNGRQQPPSYDIIVVRLFPKADMGEVQLAVDFAARDVFEQSFPVPETPFVDVPFLFVAGDETMPAEFGFPGLNVVDITEDTEQGWAPELEFTALNRPTVELPTEAAAPTPNEDVIHRVESTAVRFLNDSGIAMPFEERAHHPLAALVGAASFLAQNPEHVLYLVGHASTVGGESHNLKLSQARADGVLQLIRGERDGWIQTATDHGSLHDMKAYLSYLTREREWDCDPGEVSPENDQAAQDGVEAFQIEYNRRFEAEILEDGKCGVQTLGAIFDVLSFELDQWLEKHGLTREHLRLGSPPTLAGGEDLAGNPNMPEPAEDANRRIVDLLLVGPSLQAKLGSPTAESLYAEENEFETLRLDHEPGAWESTEVAVTFHSPAGVEGDRFRLISSDGTIELEGHADDADHEDGLNHVLFDGVDWRQTYKLVRVHPPEISTTVFSQVRFQLEGGHWDPKHLVHGPAGAQGGEA